MKRSNFEMAVDRVARLTTNEKIALMKHISALLGGPRFYTSDEVEALQVEAIRAFCKQSNARNTLMTIDTKRVN